MGWLPSNNTCSTLSSQSALSTSSRGFVAPEMGVEEGLGGTEVESRTVGLRMEKGAIRCSVHPRTACDVYFLMQEASRHLWG